MCTYSLKNVTSSPYMCCPTTGINKRRNGIISGCGWQYTDGGLEHAPSRRQETLPRGHKMTFLHLEKLRHHKACQQRRQRRPHLPDLTCPSESNHESWLAAHHTFCVENEVPMMTIRHCRCIQTCRLCCVRSAGAPSRSQELLWIAAAKTPTSWTEVPFESHNMCATSGQHGTASMMAQHP